MIYDNPLFSVIYTQYGSPINSPFGCFCTPLFHIFIRGLSRFPRITGLASEIWAKWQPQLTWRWQSYGSCCDVKKNGQSFPRFSGFYPSPHPPHPLSPTSPTGCPISAMENARNSGSGAPRSRSQQKATSRQQLRSSMIIRGRNHWDACFMGLELKDKKSVHFNAIDAIDVMLT